MTLLKGVPKFKWRSCCEGCFRWIFREAFPVLVPSTKDIRVFFTDGWRLLQTHSCCSFQMVLEIVGNAEQSHSEGDDNHSAYNDITSIDWSAYQGILQGLCSMNICSKIKYHAALHQKGHLFERDAEFFKTTLPKNVPQSFLEEFMPDVHQLQAIPRNGLPLNSDDIEAQTEVLFIYVNAALNLHRFSNTF
jgi:hypothetical protein